MHETRTHHNRRGVRYLKSKVLLSRGSDQSEVEVISHGADALIRPGHVEQARRLRFHRLHHLTMIQTQKQKMPDRRRQQIPHAFTTHATDTARPLSPGGEHAWYQQGLPLGENLICVTASQARMAPAIWHITQQSYQHPLSPLLCPICHHEGRQDTTEDDKTKTGPHFDRKTHPCPGSDSRFAGHTPAVAAIYLSPSCSVD